MSGSTSTQGSEESKPETAGPEFLASESDPSGERGGAAERPGVLIRIIRGRLVRLIVAAIGAVLALVVRLVLERHSITLPTYITFYPVVLIAALLGGMWSGIFATALSALLVDYWVLPPTGQFSISGASNIVAMVIFCISGVSISIVAELYHHNRDKLEAYKLKEAIRNERRQVEEERKLSESIRAERQRFLEVLETLPTMISLLTPDHRVVFSNRSYREKFGETGNQRCYEARFGRTEPCDICETYSVLDSAQSHHWEVIYPDGSLVDAHEYPFTDLDGSSLILEIKVDITERRRTEIELNEYREGLESLVAERTRQLQTAKEQLEADIQAREETELALRESRAKLEAALASMTDSVIITDAEGRFVEFNDAFASFYRFKSKAECARNFDEFASIFQLFLAGGELAPREAYATQRALRGETATGVEYTFRRKDTGETWIGSISFGPIRDPNGAITGAVITARDITDTKRTEAALLLSEKLAFQRQQLQALAKRLQQAREEERKMVARDLHDQIGQILTAIKMNMAWAVRHLPNSADEVHQRLTGSIEMINDGVRSVRRICSGLRPGILDDLGLAAAIEWQANEFASRTGIACQVSVPPAELHPDGDRATAIFRIFQECLTNVARHSEAKTVRASLHRQEEDLVLIVEDDGKGFRESEVAGSLGVLGMKERAQACDGSVQVSSSPGKGTTVTVRMPLHDAGAAGEDHAHTDSR